MPPKNPIQAYQFISGGIASKSDVERKVSIDDEVWWSDWRGQTIIKVVIIICVLEIITLHYITLHCITLYYITPLIIPEPSLLQSSFLSSNPKRFIVVVLKFPKLINERVLWPRSESSQTLAERHPLWPPQTLFSFHLSRVNVIQRKSDTYL